jgi:SHS2 domain-containing protein
MRNRSCDTFTSEAILAKYKTIKANLCAMKFKIIDSITSDVSFEAYGKDLPELFENAGLALLSIICDVKNVKPSLERVIEAEADRVEDLMINFLSALIASIDIEQMFYSSFSVVFVDSKSVKVLCKGESMTPELGRTLVKAVTYHDYKFLHKKHFMVRVNLDI